MCFSTHNKLRKSKKALKGLKSGVELKNKDNLDVHMKKVIKKIVQSSVLPKKGYDRDNMLHVRSTRQGTHYVL